MANQNLKGHPLISFTEALKPSLTAWLLWGLVSGTVLEHHQTMAKSDRRRARFIEMLTAFTSHPLPPDAGQRPDPTFGL